MKNFVADFRKKLGLSQPKLAIMLGLKNYQSIQAIELGRNTPSVDTAIRLAKALNTTVEELFVLED